MPELKNAFTGGKMDKDLDERLIPSGAYRDAWNIQVATSEESDIGSIQNILSNKEITSNAIPANAVCVGSIADDKNNKLYLFLASTVDMIVEYEPVNESITLVVVDSGTDDLLNFSPNSPITGINIIDDMLFWTDNSDEPKRIHIERCKEGTDASGLYTTSLINPDRFITATSGTKLKKEHITVIRKSPKLAPVLRLESKGSVSIRLYCGQPTAASFSSSTVNIGDSVILDTYDLITGYYGNAIKDYYKDGDVLYLKATGENPSVINPDFDDLWSNGSDNSFDIKLQINNGGIGNTVGDGDQIDFGVTPLTCTIIGPKDPDTGDILGNTYGPFFTITNLNEPPVIFEKKFPRFATRWRYLDGEYSAISPFSQIAFSPGVFNYHPKKGHNLGMVNTLYAAHVEQFIPINLPSDVSSVDILYREAGSSNIYIIDTISKKDPNIVGKAFNYWNSYYPDSHLSPAYSGCTTGTCYTPGSYNTSSDIERMKGTYKITSDNISKAIPENQTLRHWDNVPRKALAQEVIGNRLVYGNYLQNYDLYEGSDINSKYKARFELGIESYNPVDTQETRGTYIASKPSIKSLRTYQVGIVFQDYFGRQTPVLTSETGVINTKKEVAATQHRLVVKPLTDPPDWATHYKYFIKETSTEYYNLAMDRVYDAEDGNVWLAFPSSDRAKIDEEDYLILKKDNTGAFVPEKARYKILAIENNVPEFVKTRQRAIGEISYVDNNMFLSGASFDVSVFDEDEVPRRNMKFFTVKDVPGDITEIARVYAESMGLTSSDPITITRDIAKITLRIINNTTGIYNGKTEWLNVQKIFLSSYNATEMTVTMESPFEGGNFADNIDLGSRIVNGVVKVTSADTKIEFREGKEEYKSWFDGRFFVKIERDNTIDSRVITSSEENLIPVAKSRLYYIHSGEGLGLMKDATLNGTNVSKMPNSQDTMYAAATNATSSDIKSFNGGYMAYGGNPFYSRIVNAIGCMGSVGYCDGTTSPSSTDTCADGSCLEGHIPPADPYGAGAVPSGQTIPQEQWTGSTFKRNHAVWKHYLGLYKADGTSLPDPASNYYHNPKQSQPGIWFIDRTYYHSNMTTYPNAGNGDVIYIDQGGSNEMIFWRGACPVLNKSRFRGINCDQNGPVYSMDLSFAGVLDSTGHNSPNGGFSGDLPAGYDFSFLNNPLHAKEHDFAKKLKRGAKVRFTDDKTGPNGNPVIRTIESIQGPWSVVAQGKQYNNHPSEHYNFRVTWRITFDKPFGNPVAAFRGYNPLYTFKDVNFKEVDNSGTLVTVQCPREECTGGATYPWADAKSQATMYSTEPDHENDGVGGFDPTKMEILEDHKSVGDDDKIVPKSPIVWETEPKRDSDLDIYYEASGSYPINILTDEENPALRIGAYVRISKSNPQYYDQTTDSSGETWLQRNTLDGHQIATYDDSMPDLNSPVITAVNNAIEIGLGDTANVNGNMRLETDTILDIIFKGTRIEVVMAEPYNSAVYAAGGKRLRLKSDFRNTITSLNWYNCYVFGDDIGVESDRIRDDFNGVMIDNGPKASTTAVEGRYKEERRRSGLTYSGLYNSTSGVNNLNQFIVGEKITKKLNPTYGSIQKLHARNTDLITLCENKVLKVLANKDALFNADGNPQLISNENVLGQAVPFSGQYGISKNPESFVSEAYRAYFTDRERGVVLRLSKDGLTAISEHGMRRWFADNIPAHISGSSFIKGSYDRDKQNYNVTFKNKTISFNEGAKGWVSFQSMSPDLTNHDGSSLDLADNANDFHGVSLNNKYYTFRKGKFWKHYDGPNYNNMYGYQVNSSVTTILNESPEIVKSFNTINYEGSQSKIDQITTATIGGNVYNDNQYYNLSNIDGWYVESIFTDKGKSTEQEGVVNEFIEKEGKWFNYIKGTNALSVNELDASESSLQGLGVPQGVSIPTTIWGCTDPTANNYNPNATNDDGSCAYGTGGCTDILASNYDPTAGYDDGSCEYTGCTQPGSFNYDPSATIQCTDSCCMPWIYGCMDPNATNYSTNYFGFTVNTWCSDNATLFNTGNDWMLSAHDGGAQAGTSTSNCCLYSVDGCTDQGACNYNPNATNDDGTCNYSCIGCADPQACNYDSSNTGCYAGSGPYTPGDTSCCSYCTYGCTDIVANNYDPNADTPCGVVGDPNTPGNCINGQTGQNCCCDTNVVTRYSCINNVCTMSSDPLAQFDDQQQCIDSGCAAGGNVYGCTDTNAANYCGAGNCNTDDGTCCYGGCTASGVGRQPDVNGYCGNFPGCTGPPLYNNCYNVGVCDPDNGIYTGCGQCFDGTATPSKHGYYNINYDPELCYDCAQANPNTSPSPCYDCSDNLGQNDFSCCISSVFGCMDPAADNYDPLATVENNTCTYQSTGCTSITPGYCNYCGYNTVSPANPTASSNNCQTACPGCCETTSCEGCIDPTLGFFAAEHVDDQGVTHQVCQGSSSPYLTTGGYETQYLWQETTGANAGIWFCSKDGTLNALNAAGQDNREGWNAENYCPGCDLIQWWNMTSANQSNLPLGTHCTYRGAGCTDGGQYSQYTSSYVNSAAVASGLGYDQPSGTYGYIQGSITPGAPAFNYDPLASSDDGSCYPIIYGCTDASASNENAVCANGNFGWGVAGGPSGNVFEDVNTTNLACCTYDSWGCVDTGAIAYTHAFGTYPYNGGYDPATGQTNYFSDQEGGFYYSQSYGGSAKGWKYNPLEGTVYGGAHNLQAGVVANPAYYANTGDWRSWKADISIEAGDDPNNIINGNTIYSVIEPSCASDPASCSGNGNEDACCYLAGCIDPDALNYEYNGYNNSVRNKVRQVHPSYNPNNQWIKNFVGSSSTEKIYMGTSGADGEHRVCADCAGTPAHLYFIDPATGTQADYNAYIPGAYLSKSKVQQYADTSCCCYKEGCMDPTAINYYLDLNGGAYDPAVCKACSNCCSYTSA